MNRMDAKTLRELQAPLKLRYREDAPSARIPLLATGSFEAPGITASVETWAGTVRAGLHSATGGHGGDACSGDMLLQAVLGCAGVTMRSVATAMGIEVRSASLRAEGIFDARGTLGIDRETPVGVQDLQVVIELDTDADDEKLATLARMTERYCVVAQSLAQAPTFAVQRA